MTRVAPTVAATAFVIASVILGGAASAGVYGNAFIQVIAVLGIAFAIMSRAKYPGGTQRSLLLLLMAVFALVILQLIPMPPEIWTALPGRQVMRDTLKLAGIAPGWRPLSMTPEPTIGAGLAMIPVLAAALIGMRASSSALTTLIAAMMGVMVASVALGLMQKASGAASPLYFYENTNNLYGVGFFANSNHFGVFCALCIPLATALFVAGRGPTRLNAKWLLLVGIILFALLGVVVAWSAAGIGLSLVALISIYPIARLHRGGKLVRYGIVGGAVLAVVSAGVGLLMFKVSGASDVGGSEMARPALWHTTIAAIVATMPVGTGLGGFATVYPQFENPMAVTDIYANHAHNDYLETTMTGGVPVVILFIAFAIWWVYTTVSIWRASSRDAFSEAATVVTAIVMLHELVDYPIRTAAIAVIFGLCCGIMARPRRIVEQHDIPERAGRHLAA